MNIRSSQRSTWRLRCLSAHLALGVLATWLLGSVCHAGSLPTFDDFRRIDRVRRRTGQLQTADSLQVTRLDVGLITATAQRHPDDWQLLWGAAELVPTWKSKRPLFESALRASGTNLAVTLRFACAAADNRENDLALPWLRVCQQRDRDNLVPWLAELAMRQHQLASGASTNQAIVLPPLAATAAVFRDYGSEAARARVRLLAAIGYSPYAARRLGFMPDPTAIGLARRVAEGSLEPSAGPLALAVAEAMQQQPTFLLTELVGQTLERSWLNARNDAPANPETRARLAELDERREDIQALLAAVQESAVDVATEPEMIQYFDNVLTIGEEAALKKLAASVRRAPTP